MTFDHALAIAYNKTNITKIANIMCKVTTPGFRKESTTYLPNAPFAPIRISPKNDNIVMVLSFFQ